MRGQEVLTVVRGGGTDRLGDEQVGVEHQLRACIVYPRNSTEAADYRGNQVVTGFTVLASYDADVRATDRVRWRGRVFAVDGEPEHWKHPATRWEAGTQFFIVDTEG